MEANMDSEKTRAEQEQQAKYDAQQGLDPNSDGGQYYQDAYQAYVANHPPENQEEQSAS
jgi:hypothetical protein